MKKYFFLTIILVSIFGSCNINEDLERKGKHPFRNGHVYEVWQNGAIIDHVCHSILMHSYSDEGVYYKETNTQCNPLLQRYHWSKP